MKQLIVIVGLLMWFVSETKKPLLREQQRQDVMDVVSDTIIKAFRSNRQDFRVLRESTMD